ncbi:rubredoxin [Chloroflexota bacterium]
MEVFEIEKFECTVCGYIHDPATGDPDSDIDPETPFDALPPTTGYAPSAAP